MIASKLFIAGKMERQESLSNADTLKSSRQTFSSRLDNACLLF